MRGDVILTGGRVYTLDPDRPTASALAIRAGRLLAVGDDDAILAQRGPGAEWVDLGGRSVTPGLVDAHVHFHHFALGLQQIDLQAAAALPEALARVQQAPPPADAAGWLVGRGWAQAGWPDGLFPTAADLDTVTGNWPAYLVHKSGHAAWVNSRALAQAAITAETPDPAGGQIQRDAHGRPTGILLEEAMSLVARHIPRPSVAQIAAAMQLAQARCWEVGLTGVHDFDGRDSFLALQTLHQAGALGLRIWKNLPAALVEHAIELGLQTGFGDDWLRIGGLKIFADGALGPRTALMIEPYAGEPDNRGIAVTDKEEMLAIAAQASAHGLSLTVHAIGDRAVHDVLDVYAMARRWEQERGLSPTAVARRHRIEHVQLLHPADRHRLAALQVIASMQPTHATSDMVMADRYWGERARYSYANRTLLESGATVVFGSDCPIESIDPRLGLHAAVTRRRPDGAPGPEGWYPDQRFTLHEALAAFTQAAAYTTGQETRLGSITPGKLADLTIFEEDIFALPADALWQVGVAGCIVGGVFKYRAW